MTNPVHLGAVRLGRSAAIAAGLAAAAIAVAPTAGAQAALLGGSTCTSGLESRPFAPWGDSNLYEPVTGGNFQSTAGWTLNGGAQIVAGGDPYTAATAPKSLELP